MIKTILFCIVILIIVLIIIVITKYCKKENFINKKKIDLVYTWIYSEDEKFNKNMKNLKNNEEFIGNFLQIVNQGKNYLFNNDNSCNRMSNMNEIKYSIKSVEKFMPWINNIYIILPKAHFKHFPIKSLKNRKLILIAQEDILKNKLGNFNPNYNSNAIELCLDYINNLSDIFLYMNDDVIILKPIEISDLYKDNKILVVEQKFFNLKLTPKLAKIFTNIFTNGNETTATSRYNSSLLLGSNEYLISHSPIIIDKKVYKEIKEKFKSEILTTLNNKFRNKNDLVLPHYIYPHYMNIYKNRIFKNKNIVIKEITITDSDLLNKITLQNIPKNINFLLLNDERKKCNKRSINIFLKFISKYI